jgi:hypothetical protein
MVKDAFFLSCLVSATPLRAQSIQTRRPPLSIASSLPTSVVAPTPCPTSGEMNGTLS